jgi:hypothetical protein
LPDHLRGGERQDIRVRNPAGIAAGRGRGGFALVDEDHLVPLIEEGVRRGQSDNSRADNDDAHMPTRS